MQEKKFGSVYGELPSQDSSHAFGFTTECFFLTHRVLFCGPVRTFVRYDRIMRALHELDVQVRELEGSRYSWESVSEL